ncbi:hypothetical protein PoB_002662600 [Plakobranchus ocellatus]|uniref:Uncharacterized protein n=1 Tax=Plakobranchus ocellatus TaxID=259542 RepID=A0AAV4A033_9GAST|nr:hypothetical protein PoB_002662600 [Plakobranchus ocellatus]
MPVFPRVLWGVDGTVASESALRSAGTLLSRVRAPPSVPKPNGKPEITLLWTGYTKTKCFPCTLYGSECVTINKDWNKEQKLKAVKMWFIKNDEDIMDVKNK